jgi:hypothetical protein
MANKLNELVAIVARTTIRPPEQLNRVGRIGQVCSQPGQGTGVLLVRQH